MLIHFSYALKNHPKLATKLTGKEKEPSNTTSLDSLFVTSGFGNVNYQMPLINNRRLTEHKTKES